MEIINGIDQDDTGGDCTDIDNATIDSSIIGGTTPAAAEFTNIGIGISNVSGTSLTLPIEDDAVTPTLAFGDGDTGFYENVDDTIAIAIAGSLAWEITTNYIGSHSAEKPRILDTTTSATVPNIVPDSNDSDTGIGKAASDQLSLIAGGVEGIRISENTTITVDIADQLQGNLINNQMVSKATFDILGLMTDPRFLNLQCEDPGAGNMTDVSGQAHNGTYHGSMTSGDRQKLGMGWSVDPDGVDDYVDLGDSNDFSFGNGSSDEAVTWFGVFEVIQSSGFDIITKWDVTIGTQLREYIIYINADEQIVCKLYDESANVACSRTTNAGLSEGFHSFVVAYDGLGGATAANGMGIYVNGVVVASTVSNNASYVAMENLSTLLLIGAETGTDGIKRGFIEGDAALIGVDGSEWSAYDVHRFHQLCKGLYSI